MDLEKAVKTAKAAMPALAEAFGEDELRTSVEAVIEQNVDSEGPTRELLVSSLTGDLDDMGLRLLVEIACDLRDRLL